MHRGLTISLYIGRLIMHCVNGIEGPVYLSLKELTKKKKL